MCMQVPSPIDTVPASTHARTTHDQTQSDASLDVVWPSTIASGAGLVFLPARQAWDIVLGILGHVNIRNQQKEGEVSKLRRGGYSRPTANNKIGFVASWIQKGPARKGNDSVRCPCACVNSIIVRLLKY